MCLSSHPRITQALQFPCMQGLEPSGLQFAEIMLVEVRRGQVSLTVNSRYAFPQACAKSGIQFYLQNATRYAMPPAPAKHASHTSR